jgi:4-amino-4-deoxy-L-arabinose transferase-like glycosyltransferase
MNMSEATVRLPATELSYERRTQSGRLRRIRGLVTDGLRTHRALVAILTLAVLLNVVRLPQMGYGNLYYAAAVRSMLTSWHNFYFVAFDSAGYISVDKPPLALWIQTLSAWVFGFHGWSLLLPQATAGVLSVWLLYLLARPAFGQPTAVLAALMLAISPINVATNRNNTADSLLVCLLLGAALAAVHAGRTARLRWLVLAGVLVGLGFNMKMTQAYMVVPALAAAYYLRAPRGRVTRLAHLAVFGIVALVVSFSWMLTVDAVPSGQRPLIDGTSSNRQVMLLYWHNGLSRLVGPNAQLDVELGAPSPTRLIDGPLAGQTGWWLPPAIAGWLLGWRRRPRRGPFCARHQALALWGLWLLPQLAFYSIATFFHAYYLVLLSPAVAVLAAVAIIAGWDGLRRGSSRWQLPALLVATLALHARIVVDSGIGHSMLLAGVVVAGIVAAMSMFVVGCRVSRDRSGETRLLAVVAVGALFVAPLVWAIIPVWAGGQVQFPVAGVRSAAEMNSDVDPTQLAFLQAQRGQATFLVATLTTPEAAPFIIATGEPVLALGGFKGRDYLVPLETLADLTASGRLRFVLLPPVAADGVTLTSPILPATQRWVWQHCTEVPAALWRTPRSDRDADAVDPVPTVLFDCAG